MHNKTLPADILIVLVFLLSSCGQTKPENIQPNITKASSEISETQAVSVVELVETSVSNAQYLDECKAINSAKFTQQVPYHEIWPGTTKDTELEALWGVPDKTSIFKNSANWIYGDIGLIIEDGVVTYVLVPGGQTSEQMLEQVVLKYGCPDLVMAINSSEDQVGYASTRLIYHSAGIEVDFAGFPVTLSDKPSVISYFPPMDLQEYLERNSWTNMGVQAGRPVEWSEAIR